MFHIEPYYWTGWGVGYMMRVKYINSVHFIFLIVAPIFVLQVA